MKNSFLVHFVLLYSKMELERTKGSKLVSNNSLTKYYNKNLTKHCVKINLEKIMFKLISSPGVCLNRLEISSKYRMDNIGKNRR